MPIPPPSDPTRPKERKLSFLGSERNVLLLHDGELADLRSVLQGLGTPCWEKLTGEAPSEWDLAIATPRHLPAIASLPGAPRDRRMAIVDHDSRTLRALVRRCGIRVVVRRPVHPTALRLLLLHALYRGRERRRPRVAVGAPVSFRLGLKRCEGIVADLSLEGCRLLTEIPLALGNRVLLSPPRPDAAAKSPKVLGRVIRICDEPDYAGHSVAVQFQWLTKGMKKRIAELIRVYEGGPAALPRVTPDKRAPAAEMEPEEAAGSALEPAEEERDRRRGPRIEFTSRVVAHDQEAARVLIGRDLAIGGMRVEAHPALSIGKNFRLAIHIAHGGTSIMVKARVIRDDGVYGVALRFLDLSKADEEHLRRLIEGLPTMEMSAEDGGEEEIVLTEIVEDDSHPDLETELAT